MAPKLLDSDMPPTPDEPVNTPKVRQLRPEQSSARREHRSGQRRRLTTRSNERRIQHLTLALIISMLLLVLVLISGTIYLRDMSQAAVVFEQEARRLQREMTLIQGKAEVWRAERDELVAGRIPGLKPLVFDTIVDIGQRYLRNITFTLTSGEKGAVNYEFRLVMSNDTLATVLPSARVVLFNDLGIQIGYWDLAGDYGAEDGGAAFPMDAGEVRSYTAQIDRVTDEEAVYFQIYVD